MSKASELAARVRIVSNMINMGEKIRWGEETALMDQSADLIEAQEKTIEELSAAFQKLGLMLVSEAAIASRPGQMESLEALADDAFLRARQALASIDKGETE